MRSRKRYTNATFTKRVDHHGGKRRPLRRLHEPQVCQSCGAVFSAGRWHSAVAQSAAAGKHKSPEKFAGITQPPPSATLCPACRQIRDGVAGGFVELRGDFLAAHREEIERLLVNEERRAIEDNPLSRIMKRDASKAGVLVVSTTTEHLAQRLGHALEKAFGGTVRYDFSHENKLARVYWQRG